MGRSNINVTISTALIAARISHWKVEDITDSDHKVITFNIEPFYHGHENEATKVRYATDKADWPRFGSHQNSTVHRGPQLGGTYAESAEALEESFTLAARTLSLSGKAVEDSACMVE